MPWSKNIKWTVPRALVDITFYHLCKGLDKCMYVNVCVLWITNCLYINTIFKRQLLIYRKPNVAWNEQTNISVTIYHAMISHHWISHSSHRHSRIHFEGDLLLNKCNCGCFVLSHFFVCCYFRFPCQRLNSVHPDLGHSHGMKKSHSCPSHV